MRACEKMSKNYKIKWRNYLFEIKNIYLFLFWRRFRSYEQKIAHFYKFDIIQKRMEKTIEWINAKKWAIARQYPYVEVFWTS